MKNKIGLDTLLRGTRIGMICLSGILLLSGCNSFLDVEPDNRTKIDSPDKVRDLLVSGYSEYGTMPLFEHRTDNVLDNGPKYSSGTPYIQKNYFWQGVDDQVNESADRLWQGSYTAISVANLALKSIEEMGTPDNLLPYKGEALMIRAYYHFVLANSFCMPYSPSTAGQHLGVHYMKVLEDEIGIQYERGTLAETYASIEKDILEGLPLITDDAYEQPAFHFNTRAANAFAAKFFLYSEKWVDAERYAGAALGNNPADYLYDYASITAKVGSDLKSWPVEFARYDNSANFLITPLLTGFFQELALAARYGHHNDISMEQTVNSSGPWGGVLPVFASILLGNPENQYLVKYYPMIEWLNRLAGTGYYRTPFIAFNGDETLLYRAEARVMQKKYAEAAADLEMWYKAFGAPNQNYTPEFIARFYQDKVVRKSPVAKPLNPKFALESGMQTNMMHAVLHARRIETFENGQRWEDIRRYGIEITHNVVNGASMTLKADDPRYAIPIPTINVVGGVEPNPGQQ